MHKIRTYNQIAVKGLERFARDAFEVGSDIAHPDAFLIRSHKLHGQALPDSLLAVARAGAGVNNVPVDAMSRAGVAVFNTPGANANAVKELVLAGMLLASRGILQGLAHVNALDAAMPADAMAAQLEKDKSRFAGSELRGKTLGLVGLGAIGSMVADAALALGMRVVGFDPALSIDAAWRLSNEVQRMENLPGLLSRADYVSLHVPALDVTHHLINAVALQQLKPHAVLLNFARESIVDSHAVLAALNANKLRAYVCDFPEPDLLRHPGVVATPHLGASTEEAEENCAVMAANQLVDYLQHGNITHAVNFPAMRMERAQGTSRITFSNDNVAGVLGQVLSVLAERKVNVVDMLNKSRGELAYNLIDVDGLPPSDLATAIAAVPHVVRVRMLALRQSA
jgi:D-3-phosphoglycerate dehydrogenase / 2-oxoglutarate reductase